MRRLSPRVNVIPVIGKSDTLTPTELRAFKKRIMEDIEHYSIPIYNFPYDIEEDDEETIAENSELRGLLPFSIVGSEEEVTVDGVLLRARRYPWGHVVVDDPKHCDFSKLRYALLHSHLSDLKEITDDFVSQELFSIIWRVLITRPRSVIRMLPNREAFQGCQCIRDRLSRHFHSARRSRHSIC